MAPLRYAAKFDPFLSSEMKGKDQILPSGNLACNVEILLVGPSVTPAAPQIGEEGLLRLQC